MQQERAAHHRGDRTTRAAHHRGDRTTRGDVIRRPQHMDPRSQAGPGALQAWARADQGQGLYIDAGHTGCGCESPNIRVGGIRRPPYVADVEGRARIEGVAASIHESYMDAHGNRL